MLQRAATKGGVASQRRRRPRAPNPSIVAVDAGDVSDALPPWELHRAVLQLPSTAPVGVVAVARLRSIPQAYPRLLAGIAPPAAEDEAVAATSLRALSDVSPPVTSFACVASWHPVMDGATCARSKHIVVDDDASERGPGSSSPSSLGTSGLGGLLAHCHASRKAEAAARLERKADRLPEADALSLAIHGGVRSLRAAEAAGSGTIGLECLAATSRSPGLRARWNRALGRIAGNFDSLPAFAEACTAAGACSGQEGTAAWVSAHLPSLGAEAAIAAVIKAGVNAPAATVVALVSALGRAPEGIDAARRALARQLCQAATPDALVAAASRIASPEEPACTSRRECQRCGCCGSAGDAACGVCGEELWLGSDAVEPSHEVCTSCRAVFDEMASPGGLCAACGAMQTRHCDVCEFPLDGPSFCRVCDDFVASCSDAASLIVDAAVPPLAPPSDDSAKAAASDTDAIAIAKRMEDLVHGDGGGGGAQQPRSLAEAFPLRKPSRCAGCGSVVRGATCGSCGRFVDDATPEELFGVSCAAIATSRWDFKPTLRAVGLLKARVASSSPASTHATGATTTATRSADDADLGNASTCESEEAVRMARFLVRRVAGLVVQDALPAPALKTALDIVDVANRGEAGDRVGLETLALLRSAHTGDAEDPESLRLSYLLHMGLPRDVLTGRQCAEIPSTPASEALETELEQRQPRKKLSWFD